MIAFAALFEAAVLASSLSVDAFTAGFAYGSKKIKIPMLSVQVINLICSVITGLSLCFGAILRPWLPEGLALGLAFAILFVMGLTKLLDSFAKSVIRKHVRLDKKLHFSLYNIKFLLNIYADPEEADADVSGNISPAEAAALAVSLSLDGVAVGFGAALAQVNGWAVFVWSLVTNMAAIVAGRYIGQKIADTLPFNISWISGAVLIGLALGKLIH